MGAFYFKDKAASIKVEWSSEDEQWIFFNNWCGKDAQIGSFLGDGCMTMGETKIKAVNNILPQGSQKRSPVGTVKTWKNTDCSGSPTNEMQFIGENLPVTLNDVSSIKVATLENGKCVNVKGKNVKPAMAIGVPTPPGGRDVASQHRFTRSLMLEARELENLDRRDDGIKCDASNGPDYQGALKVGDKWQGDHDLECCCHVPGGPNSKSSGCPADPSGMSPPPTQCPLNCNEMRSYVYAIATKCKNSDGKTGGTATMPDITALLRIGGDKSLTAFSAQTDKELRLGPKATPSKLEKNLIKDHSEKVLSETEDAEKAP
ncbi:hypothetical protein F4776DRAFT_672203 [Hypoxylon sp. NC0597]|nr:hypothetical protein F4776DRAFT_672203 [Hypoxylon sp. NC0597]